MTTGSDLESKQSKTGVLVIEDDETVALLVEAGLSEMFSVTVHTATSGSQARSIWQTHADEIVAVLSDLNLGAEKGTSIIRELTGDRPDVRIVFMTGHVDDPLQISRDVGKPVQVLLKPFKIGQLCSFFEDCLSPVPQT
jgi:two-component system, cell cycle sensor histidine kinase and response regulator CckA